jgi:hypothetical protein
MARWCVCVSAVTTLRRIASAKDPASAYCNGIVTDLSGFHITLLRNYSQLGYCLHPSASRITNSPSVYLLIDSSRMRFFVYAVPLHRKRSRPLGPPPIA